MSRPVTMGCLLGSLLCLITLAIFLGVDYSRIDPNGLEITGPKAIELARKQGADIEGKLTIQRLLDVYEYNRSVHADTSNMIIDDNGNKVISSFAYGAYLQKHYEVMNLIRRVFSEVGEYNYYIVDRLSPADVKSFYDKRDQRIHQLLNMKTSSKGMDLNEIAYFLEQNAKVKIPFWFGYTGAWSEIIRRAFFTMFLLIALCVCVGVAPVFASEFENNSASVLLASRYGRTKAVWAKLIAAMAYTSLVFIIMAGVLSLSMFLSYGIDGYKTSFQVLSLFSIYNLNLLQVYVFALLIGYSVMLGLCALVSLISSFSRSSFSVIVVSLALFTLPTFLPASSASEILNKFFSIFPIKAINVFNVFSMFKAYKLFDMYISLPVCIIACSLISVVFFLFGAYLIFSRRQVLN